MNFFLHFLLFFSTFSSILAIYGKMTPYKGIFQPNGKENWVPSDELGFFDLDLEYVRQINTEIWLAWTPGEDTYTFALAVNTLGWIAFGVSETGGMIHAEICAIYENTQGQIQAFTHMSTNYTYPPLSSNQQCQLFNYTQTANESMAVFTRNTYGCKPEGVDIYSEWDNRFIFAFGETQIFSYHGRNVAASEFNAAMGPPPTYELPPDTQIHNAHMKPHEIHPVKEFYQCVPGEFPADKRYHAVLVEPYFPNVIEPAEHHHLNVFVCPFLGTWPPNYQDGEQGECTNPLGLECATYFYSWLMGQQETWYMEAGLVLGKDVAQFYVMQEHIHNPFSQAGLYDEGWGLNFYYTATLLPEECGNIGFLTFLPLSGIPPRTPNFTISDECGSPCTAAGIPEGGVQVMAVSPHMHRVGVEMGVQHFRYNESLGMYVELPAIHHINAWDPLFQGWRQRRSTLTILPGDYVRMYCRYDSSNWTEPVYNGEGYDDEMCMMPMMVRPRIPMSGCFSLDAGVSDKGNSFCLIDIPFAIEPIVPIYEQPYIPREDPPNQCPS